MEIKTVWTPVISKFDSYVNDAMADGWKLIKREVLVDQNNLTNSVFYAELVKLSEADELSPTPEPPTWEEAVEVLTGMCKTRASCADCPAIKWCNAAITEGALSPAEWPDPYEEVNT